ncbi:hypothetical protein BDR04DRAFT_201972 [Suillus decipiens]|nr:hypothetical protein BDR04DRAFT_201972 [Suillus decipiens]
MKRLSRLVRISAYFTSKAHLQTALKAKCSIRKTCVITIRFDIDDEFLVQTHEIEAEALVTVSKSSGTKSLHIGPTPAHTLHCVFLIQGPPGTGKTTVMTASVNGMINTSPSVYRFGLWRNPRLLSRIWQKSLTRLTSVNLSF